MAKKVKRSKAEEETRRGAAGMAAATRGRARIIESGKKYSRKKIEQSPEGCGIMDSCKPDIAVEDDDEA